MCIKAYIEAPTHPPHAQPPRSCLRTSQPPLNTHPPTTDPKKTTAGGPEVEKVEVLLRALQKALLFEREMQPRFGMEGGPHGSG